MYSSQQSNNDQPVVLDDTIMEEIAGPRHLIDWQAGLLFSIALSWSLFQLSVGSFLLLNSTLIRSIHLAFALTIVFLTYPYVRKLPKSKFFAQFARRDRFHLFELILAVVAAVMALYIALDYTGIAERIGNPIPRDRAFGVLLFVILLEAARRVVGPALPILASVITAYAFFGPYMPSIIAFRGISLDGFLGQITMSTEGIYGVPLGVSANIVFLFVLFGSMLEKAGGGNYFIQLSTALLGNFRGGPAKAAILSSGLTGMINGSSIANVVTTGTFTIPLMKSVGYPPAKAGAIETAASVGGQLMPPIMGAAAFIMAEYVNMPYVNIIKAGFLPAFVAYTSLFYISHLEACKLGLRGLSRSEMPRLWPTFLSGLHYFIPIFVLIYKLVILRHTPESSAFLAIIFLAWLMVLQDPIRAYRSGKPLFPALRGGFRLLIEGLVVGARNNVTVAVACAAAGIIVGIVTTGPGGMLTEAVAFLSSGNIYLLLLITAVACVILGMGLPTTANYIVMASLTAPIIVKVGAGAEFVVPLIVAHMFVFYFGILADVTPPVGLAAYAAAAIARANPIKTGLQGFYYIIPTVVMPFMFIFNTELLLWGVTTWIHGIFLFVTATLAGLVFISAAQGWMLTRHKWYEIIILLAVSLMVFQPTLPPRLIGIEMNYRIRITDLHNLDKWTDYMADKTNPLARFLDNTLTTKSKILLKHDLSDENAYHEAALSIANDMNDKIQNFQLINVPGFRDISMSEQTKHWLKQNPVGKRLFRLNRMLLHDAYPDFINLSKLTRIERMLGFHPKYFSFIPALLLWWLVYTNQRRRIRKELTGSATTA